MIQFTFPWPPTVNNYWGQSGKRRFVDDAGLAFRKIVWAEVKRTMKGQAPLSDKLQLSILASPPDNRIRDLDNILKSLQDAMKYAGVYKDDSQIDILQIARSPERRGQVHITIATLAAVTETEASIVKRGRKYIKQ